MNDDQSTEQPEPTAPNGAAAPWYANKTLLIAWLLAFFPVGLYGLWKGEVFEKNLKIGITIAIAILFVGGLFKLNTPIYPLILFPAALYLLWKAPDIARTTLYKFGAGWLVVMVLYLANVSAGGGGSGFDDDYFGGSCTSTFRENGCTYFRDDQCNVIAKDCG